MSERTKIEWADSTWSPWRGCTKWSEGCANCYAETLARRNPAVLGGWGKGAPRVLNKDWEKPRRWDHRLDVKSNDYIVQRPRIFPSLCDWLDDEVPIEWLARFLALIHDTPNLCWLLLTKRPENFFRVKYIERERPLYDKDAQAWLHDWVYNGNPPSNVWFGVSVENQKRAAERVPILLQIPAAVRWLSLEPLLGPVDLKFEDHSDGMVVAKLPMLDWLVVGGESGPGARPCHTGWIYNIVRDASLYSVPVFVKQLGAKPEIEAPSGGFNQPVPVTDKKGGDPSEWPDYLRVRQMPKGR